MIITCPSCTSRFAVKAESIGFSGRKVRCAKCKFSWFQDPDEELLAAAETITKELQENIHHEKAHHLPATVNNSATAWYIKFAFAAAFIFFLFALSIVSSGKILPHMGWYYNAMGIHDDSGISLYNVSAEKVGEGEKKELLVKGRIVNESKGDRAIPNLRITLTKDGHKELRTVMLDSHDAALAPGEGVDFENSIKDLPESLETVVMDIGSSVSLASR